MSPGNTGSGNPGMQGRSSADSMMSVTGWSTAPAGTNTAACPCVVTIVVLCPGCTVPSPQSESTRSHCEPTPMKKWIGSVRSASSGMNSPVFIPLLADRTLPIHFFIGVGSQCERVDSDCGEGTVQPGQSTTIVTAHGQAGVFIPVGAVDHPVTLIIESADERPCIPGLPEPVFPGNLAPSAIHATTSIPSRRSPRSPPAGSSTRL